MELTFTLAKNATKPNPFKIIPLQTTRKENNWKTEETLAGAVVTLETERIKGSNSWCLLWWWSSYFHWLPKQCPKHSVLRLTVCVRLWLLRLLTLRRQKYIPVQCAKLSIWITGFIFSNETFTQTKHRSKKNVPAVLSKYDHYWPKQMLLPSGIWRLYSSGMRGRAVEIYVPRFRRILLPSSWRCKRKATSWNEAIFRISVSQN
jgi:hypothetical protein